MATIDISEYKNLYLKTAREYLEILNKNLVVLEQNQNDHEALNQMFIAAHSLKSQSQVMNYMEIVSLALSIEKTARDLLDKSVMLDNDIFSMLKNNTNQLNSSFEKIEKENL